VTLLSSRRAERDQAAVNELVARVHGASTCGDCGQRTGAEAHRTTTGLDGTKHRWATCADCAFAGRDLSRAVLVERLGLDPDMEVLAYCRVPRYCEQPGARPDRPAAEPWSHVGTAELARLVEEVRDHLASVTDEPCAVCGDTRRSEDAGRTTDGWDQACADRLTATIYDPADFIAGWLAGLPQTSAPPVGIGAKLGVKLYMELTPDEQAAARRARQPFSWHTTAEIVGWRRQLGLDKPPPLPPPPRLPRRVGRGRAVPPRPQRPPKQVHRPDPAEIVERQRARW
jgi:hypothetical protein